MTSEQLKKLINGALEDLKAFDVTEIDVHEMTSVTDWMVIASGTSSRHVKSIADAVVLACKKAGVAPLGVEGEREGEWVLVDLGDIIVHVMLPGIREFYALEKLWSVAEESREYKRR
jgi:ribosome-associated protein